ncbi:MAG: hypothetical protein HOV68_29040 [Streptomycetaceae bacterium]|nr:hypothetical protein [Streptomycetaceae bacterium]
MTIAFPVRPAAESACAGSSYSTTADDAFFAWNQATELLASDHGHERDHVVGDRFALALVEHCEGDPARLTAAADHCTRAAAATRQAWPVFTREHARAADLCRRAATLAGASPSRSGTFLHHPTAPATASLQGDPTYDRRTGRIHFHDAPTAELRTWTLNTPGMGIESGLICAADPWTRTIWLHRILGEAVHEPKFALWNVRPAESSPDAFDRPALRIAADPQSATELLRDACDIIRQRRAEGALGDPSPERRGLLIAIRDAHTLFANPATAAHAWTIARSGGTAGVAVLATSTGTDPAAFAGNTVLRDALARTNLHRLDEAAASDA